MEQRMNAGEGETGDLRENPPDKGNVRPSFPHVKVRVTPPSPWREESSLTTKPPRPPKLRKLRRPDACPPVSTWIANCSLINILPLASGPASGIYISGVFLGRWSQVVLQSSWRSSGLSDIFIINLLALLPIFEEGKGQRGSHFFLPGPLSSSRDNNALEVFPEMRSVQKSRLWFADLQGRASSSCKPTSPHNGKLTVVPPLLPQHTGPRSGCSLTLIASHSLQFDSSRGMVHESTRPYSHVGGLFPICPEPLTGSRLRHTQTAHMSGVVLVTCQMFQANGLMCAGERVTVVFFDFCMWLPENLPTPVKSMEFSFILQNALEQSAKPPLRFSSRFYSWREYFIPHSGRWGRENHPSTPMRHCDRSDSVDLSRPFSNPYTSDTNPASVGAVVDLQCAPCYVSLRTLYTQACCAARQCGITIIFPFTLKILWHISETFDTRVLGNKQPLATPTCLGSMVSYVHMLTAWRVSTVHLRDMQLAVHAGIFNVPGFMLQSSSRGRLTDYDLTPISYPEFEPRASRAPDRWRTNRLRYGSEATERKSGWRKRETPEKTRRPVASSSAIPACEDPGVTRPGIEPGSSLVGGEQVNSSATAAPRLPPSHPGEPSSIIGGIASLILTCRNRTGRCRRSVGFLGDLLFPRPCISALLHPLLASFSPAPKTSIVKSHPNLSTQLVRADICYDEHSSSAAGLGAVTHNCMQAGAPDARLAMRENKFEKGRAFRGQFRAAREITSINNYFLNRSAQSCSSSQQPPKKQYRTGCDRDNAPKEEFYSYVSGERTFENSKFSTATINVNR
ncbi:hypothetical protein PR048_024600 [Dryococelus australis]|uniref:Uncharacterized protein n=1 Tax=Dryococelus australis TaxID=614101 RepID=A0ABQ9GP18_9NEOP|nr:hypothetical protein PR048_024600 [Dryococelus australis]